jgi:hypothetical protein
MTLFTRLFEKITGRPHRRANADLVSEAARDLRRDAEGLRSKLRPYSQADDPLVALMTDVFNQRQAQKQIGSYGRNGGNGGAAR